MQKLAWELNFCWEKFSLLERFYQKWTIFWPRPGQSRPDPDNKGQTKRARSRPDRASQTCTKHRACAGKLPNAGQARARQSRPEASQSSQDASKKQARIVIFSYVFDEFVFRCDSRKEDQKQAKAGKTQARNRQESSHSHVFLTILCFGLTAENRPEASQSRQDASKKQAGIVIFSFVFDDFVLRCDNRTEEKRSRNEPKHPRC